MKKIFRFSALILTLLITISFAFACTPEESKDPLQDFIGRFDSIFVDQQNDKETVSFTLNIREDNTFSLIRRDSAKTTQGTWTVATMAGTKQMMCYADEEDKDTNKWHAFFSLSMTDDGKIIATPGTNAKYFAFGFVGSRPISLIIFEKTL